MCMDSVIVKWLLYKKASRTFMDESYISILADCILNGQYIYIWWDKAISVSILALFMFNFARITSNANEPFEPR